MIILLALAALAYPQHEDAPDDIEARLVAIEETVEDRTEDIAALLVEVEALVDLLEADEPEADAAAEEAAPEDEPEPIEVVDTGEEAGS